MNISKQDIEGVCNLKCVYTFNYPEYNFTFGQSQKYLFMSPQLLEGSKQLPITFNNEKYFVEDVQIYSPSLHLYNGSKVEAEIMILHNSPTTGQILKVYIPIVSNSGYRLDASSIIEKIILETSELSSSSDKYKEKNNINKIDNVTLNNFIPLKPFFNYTDNNNNNNIVFGMSDAISINKKHMEILQKLIKPDNGIVNISKLFLNTLGPNHMKTSGEIYIDCQPTGNSEITKEVVTINKPDINFDVNNILSNPIVVFLISGFVVFFIILILNYFINFLATGEIPNPLAKSTNNNSNNNNMYDKISNFVFSKKK